MPSATLGYSLPNPASDSQNMQTWEINSAEPSKTQTTKPPGKLFGLRA